MEYAVFICALISVRAEVVALRLNQVGRQDGSTVAVIVSDGCAERRYRNTVLNGVSNHVTQCLLIVICNLLEVRCQQQVSNGRRFCVGISDFLQELGANDATGTENLGDFTVVKIPVVLF